MKKHDKIFISVVVICILVVGSYAYTILKPEIELDKPKNPQKSDITIMKNETNLKENVSISIHVDNTNGINLNISK